MSKMAETLKQARERKGWTLREAARRAGVPPSTLWKLENGLLQNPTFVTIAALSNALGIRGRVWEALFEGLDEETHEQRS